MYADLDKSSYFDEEGRASVERLTISASDEFS
jgi:hypothetical protein